MSQPPLSLRKGKQEASGQSLLGPLERFVSLGSSGWVDGLSGMCLARIFLRLILWVGVPLPSPSSAETINDGQFHTVELVTFDQMVNLSIDGGSPMTMDNFGKHYTLNSEAPLYVGGEDLPDRATAIPLQASHLATVMLSPGRDLLCFLV